jgi:hypothetical protein
MVGNVCKLCQKESKLRYSHILPEFFYLPLYDDLHRAMSIPSDEKEKLVQKGMREYLLCQECETKLSKYEGYAARLIPKIPNFPRDSSGLFVYSDDLDYKQFKLFQLSILWRASVSQSKMFAQVNLGSKHEERIRCMLHEEIPGRSSDYGCFMVTFPNPKKLSGIIWSPARVKLFGHNGYKLMTGNLMWYFFVTSHAPNAEFQNFFVQESGMLRVWLDMNGEEKVYTNIFRALNSRKI